MSPIAVQDCPEIALEQWSFLERIFRIKLSKRTWTQLVTLDTLHWYCDGLQPTAVTCHYDSQVHKRKSIILVFFFDT